MSKANKPPIPSYMSKSSQKRGGIGDRMIRFKCSLQNTMLDVLRSRGWQEVTGDGEWDIYWCDVGWMKEYFDHYYMDEHVRICHFRNHYELTRKNLMVKNLKRFRKQIDRESGKLEAQKCDFFPMTFELPQRLILTVLITTIVAENYYRLGCQLTSEYHIFVEEFKKNHGQIWIMKPVARAQGKGIFLFRKLKDIVEWKKTVSVKGEYQAQPDPNKDQPETYVVQRYIEDPYLIGGRKFDLRVYVLVMSYVPLKVWLYRGGFARFSNMRFSIDSIDDTYVHLTNVAVQKTNPDYDPDKGSKWSCHQLRNYLVAKHGYNAVDNCFRLIDDIFIKSLQSVQRIIINDKHCFELYGYDILLDVNLKPWLIEVNASPSLTASSKEDYDLKTGLLEDVLNVIDLENRLTNKERHVGGFDLMWDDGPVYADENFIDGTASPPLNSYLGCAIDRKRQLKQMYKAINATKRQAVTSAEKAGT